MIVKVWEVKSERTVICSKYNKALMHEHAIFCHKYHKERYCKFHKEEVQKKTLMTKNKIIKRKTEERKIEYLKNNVVDYSADENRANSREILKWVKDTRKFAKVKRLER